MNKNDVTTPQFDFRKARWAAADQWRALTIADSALFVTLMRDPFLAYELARRALSALKLPCYRTGVTVKYTKEGNLLIDTDKGPIEVIMRMLGSHQLPCHLWRFQDRLGHNVRWKRHPDQPLEVRPTYVIFFCTFDYFGKGAARYEFEYRNIYCLTQGLGDQRRLIIFNATAKKFRRTQDLRYFLEYLYGDEPRMQDFFIHRLHNAVRKLKNNKELRAAYMKAEVTRRYREWQAAQPVPEEIEGPEKA